MPEESTAQFEDILGPLREQHGELAMWNVPGHGLVVAAVPENHKEYQKLVNDLRDTRKDNAVSLEQFALACVVHPDRDATRRIFRSKPAFALMVAKRGQELCGSTIEELGKD